MKGGNDTYLNVNKTFLSLILIFLSLFVIYITARKGYELGLLSSFLPLIAVSIIYLIRNPRWCFYIILVFNYYIMGVSRYITTFPPGVAVDILLGLLIIVLIISSIGGKPRLEPKGAYHALTFLAIIWLLYCILQIINPNSSSIVAWLTGVRALGVYFIIIIVMTSIIMTRFKDLKTFLFIWAILSLTAVLKAFIQKTFGLDAAETYWLYYGGGSTTHLLYYGIRYFSFFTDAANFGSGMAFSGVVFAISSFYYKERKLKIFYIITALICAYGMIISGTRGSIAVPFVGFTVYVLLSRNLKKIILISVAIVLAFTFLKYTDYGQGNVYVRRMRSLFSKDDASLMVRVENQKRLKTYMWNKPFGVGIAMSRGGAKDYKPDPIFSKIPSDSWYVRVWVETGIIGLSIHVFILLYVIIYGVYLVWVRLESEQVKGFVTAIICGLLGVYVAAYSLEIIGQFPNAFIIYMCMTFIFLSPMYDEELKKIKNNEMLQYE